LTATKGAACEPAPLRRSRAKAVTHLVLFSAAAFPLLVQAAAPLAAILGAPFTLPGWWLLVGLVPALVGLLLALSEQP
jgi:hypothetical protein